MSVEGSVPPEAWTLITPASRRTLAVGLIAAAAAACGNTPPAHVVAHEASREGSRVAQVRLIQCGNSWCESLWLGPAADNASRIVTLPEQAEHCDEIAWTRDGKRVAFLINGYQLRLYDAQTHAPAGLVDLVPADATPTTRIARGITFSDTGAAVTFDDCPRDRSGCRPGLLAIR